MDKILKTLVKIEGCETKPMSNGKFMSKLKASDGKNYIIFHEKKDGNKTMAYASLEKLPMSGINSFVEISYKEETFEKDGTQYTSRKALGIQATKQPEGVQEKPQEVNNEIDVNKINFGDDEKPQKDEDGFLPVN